MPTRSILLLVLITASGWISGCASPDSSSDTEASGQDVVGVAGAGATSTVECTVDTVKGAMLAKHDDVASFAFKVKDFGTPTAKLQGTGWKVADSGGHALKSDGARSSVVAEGLDNGGDIHQCRIDATKKVVCGQFVMSLDNSGSEMPVTVSLTKKSGYSEGTLTIDNTINTGDNSGWLHAPVKCTTSK